MILAPSSSVKRAKGEHPVVSGIATSPHPSSQPRSRWHRFALPVMAVAVFGLIGFLSTLFLSTLRSTANSQSWYRNLTGKHLSLEEPSTLIRVGVPSDFSGVGVYTDRRNDGVWIVRLPEAGLVALSTFCTYDGCSTDSVELKSYFKCPCCGSDFEMGGTVLTGPATRPLERYKVYLHRGSIMLNRSPILDGSSLSDE